MSTRQKILSFVCMFAFVFLFASSAMSEDGKIPKRIPSSHSQKRIIDKGSLINVTSLKDIKKILFQECVCCNPSHVTIVCNGSWKSSVDFHHFSDAPYTPDSETGIYSSQNGYGAFCIGPKYVAVSQMQICSDHFNDKACDEFCESQFTNQNKLKLVAKLQSCIDYFENQCNGSVSIDGSYGNSQAGIGQGENSSPDTWYAIYGLCGKTSEALK